MFQSFSKIFKNRSKVMFLTQIDIENVILGSKPPRMIRLKSIFDAWGPILLIFLKNFHPPQTSQTGPAHLPTPFPRWLLQNPEYSKGLNNHGGHNFHKGETQQSMKTGPKSIEKTCDISAFRKWLGNKITFCVFPGGAAAPPDPPAKGPPARPTKSPKINRKNPSYLWYSWKI